MKRIGLTSGIALARPQSCEAKPLGGLRAGHPGYCFSMLDALKAGALQQLTPQTAEG